MHLPREKQNKANIDCSKKLKGNAWRFFFKVGIREGFFAYWEKWEEGMVMARLCHSHQALGFPGEGVGEGGRVHVNLVGRGLCVQSHRPCIAHPGLPHSSLTDLTLPGEVSYSQSPQNPDCLAQDRASYLFFYFLSSLSSCGQKLFLLIAFRTFQTC